MKVQKKQCNQCLLSKNHVVSGKKRVREILKHCAQRDTYFQCHKGTISGVDVCCRGYWDSFKDNFNLGRIVQRLGGPEFVEVTEEGEINAT